MMTPTPPIHASLSRAHKSQPYLPHRKRKRPRDDDPRFEVRPSTHGVGMFAAAPLSCGDLIIAHEEPIVHCRTMSGGAGNDATSVCDVCATPIGSLRDHLVAPQDLALPYLEDTPGLVFTTSQITCQDCNTASWCSDECHRKGRAQHAILCCASSLEVFYGAQDNATIFRLAAEAMALILSKMASLPAKERMPIEQLYFWRDYGSHPFWWEVGLSGEKKKESAQDFHRVLQEATLRSVRNKRMELSDALVGQVCSLENVGCILGMLQCNVMEYEYPSPRQQYIEHAEEFVLAQVKQGGDCDEQRAPNDAGGGVHAGILKAGCKWLVNNVLNKAPALEATNSSDEQQSNPAISPIVGSGLYPLLTLANHDCNPNASIEFLQEFNRGSMVATRDISAGEEICITYVPNGGVGGGDGPEYFRHFEPTGTWRWLSSKDDGCSEEESSDDDDGSTENVEDDLDAACNEEDADDDQSEHDEPLEGSDQKDRANALLEYDFECQCKRCLSEQKGFKEATSQC